MTDSTASSRVRPADPLVSVVVPFLNETAILDMFFEALMPHLRALGTRFEVICVDNGSTDATFDGILRWRAANPEIKALRFSRYFGKEVAMTAGLDHASGDAVIVMDPDLQDPPEMIPEFLAKWREGVDMVVATRRSSGIESPAKTLLNRWFYRIFNFVSECGIPDQTGDFRLIDRRIVEVVRHAREKSRFLRGLTAWAGFTSASILFDRPERRKGKSKSNWIFLWGYALDAILSTTNRPLRIWTYIGTGISVLSLFMAGLLIIRTLVFGKDVVGYASMMVTILFLGGVQLMSIGIVAEYVGRVYREVQNRPLYVIDRSYGLDAGQFPPAPKDGGMHSCP